MFRIDDATAAAALPTPEAAGTEGYFTEGQPGVTEATLVRASWLNMIQEELRSIVVAAGLAPSKTTYNQLLTALRSAGVFTTPTTGDRSTKAATTQMFANEFAASLVSNGKQVLPSGLIIKMGTSGAILANSSLSITFAEAFPNGVIAAGAFNSYGTAGSTIDTSVGVRYDSNTGITIFNKGTANVTGAPWIAIGY